MPCVRGLGRRCAAAAKICRGPVDGREGVSTTHLTSPARCPVTGCCRRALAGAGTGRSVQICLLMLLYETCHTGLVCLASQCWTCSESSGSIRQYSRAWGLARVSRGLGGTGTTVNEHQLEIDLTADTLVVLSAGMESVTALNYVRRRSAARVAAIFVNLGQESSTRQLARSKEICNALGVHLEIVDIPNFRNLFLDVVEPPHNLVAEGPGGLAPDVFGCGDSCGSVLIAGLYAANHGYEQTIYGATASDLDRAPEILTMLKSTEVTIRANWGRDTAIVAPFLDRTDEDVARLAASDDVDLSRTWSCHWGHVAHCGECERCVKRHRVFSNLAIDDRTEYLAAA